MKHFLFILCFVPLLACGQAFTHLDVAMRKSASDARWINSGNEQLMGGLNTNEWVFAGANELVGTYTSVNEGTMGMMRTPGVITRILWWCDAVDAVNKSYKIKLFRPVGTNVYNIVYSTTGTAAVGTNEITGLSWTVYEGDQLSWWAEDADTIINCTAVGGNASGKSGFRAGESTGDGVTSSTTGVNLVLDIAAYGYGPAIAYMGDSIINGYPNYNPFLASGTFLQGMASNSVPWRVREHEGVTALYINASRPNITADTLNSVNISYATNCGAKLLWVHVGINDVGTGVSMADYFADLDSIRAKWGAGNPFLIAELLPASTFNDTLAATVRTWNANLALWVTTNNATLVTMHDAFGQTRGSTGEKDDLLAAYSLDGVHLSNAGLAEYAKWVKTNTLNYLR